MDDDVLKNERIGLIAGDGLLPVHVAENAKKLGLEPVVFSIGKDNRNELKRICDGRFHEISPGLLEQNFALGRREGIRQLVFAGKVNKWILFKDPRMDKRALKAMNDLRRCNDDGLMLGVFKLLEEEGIEVLSQTRFLQEHFLPERLLTTEKPTETELADIEYGFQMAKEMGRLDIGQSIVVSQGMVLAVEAIEGTDECLKRAGKWGQKRGGVVVKVAKPNQDQRFDVPTVGVKTLKTMRKAGLRVLATEANETLFLDPEDMIEYANKHGMAISSVRFSELSLSEPLAETSAECSIPEGAKS